MGQEKGLPSGPSLVEPDVRARLERIVSDRLAGRLESLGFEGDRMHFVRRTAGVLEVVEVQHSVYGSRLTANLGLDLGFLRPLIRWIPRPPVGPHAHDCVRWLRVGLAGDRREDAWWTYEPEDEDSMDEAAQALAATVEAAGLAWIQRERTPEAFLEHAARQVERSRSRTQPEGGYLELRLLAAVHAWRGDFETAQSVCGRAAEGWEAERSRLVMARKIYRRRHPKAPARLPPVPPLQRELERITEPTTGLRLLRRAGVRS